MDFGMILYHLMVLLLLLFIPEPQVPAQAPKGACAGDVSVLYPANSAVLSIGSGRFPQSYLAVESCSPRICRFSEQNVGYDSMTPFSNSGDGLYQTNRLFLDAGKTYTYFISCRGADGTTTKPVKASFSMDAKPSSVASNVMAVARSASSVELIWYAPNETPKQYKVLRDGVVLATQTTETFVDRTIEPARLYHYSVVSVFANGEETVSPEVPVKTLRSLPDATPVASIVLDDFELPIRIVNSHLTLPHQRDLWSVYPGGDISRRTQSIGAASITTEDAHSGKSSLKGVLTGEVPPPSQKAGGMYLFFYPYTEKDNHWHFMHEYIRSGTWKPNSYNRMRIWVKVPKSFAGTRKPVGQFNTDVGTFIRSSNGRAIGSGGSESGLGGGHFYHRFNIPYSGQWHQLIVDTHPTHERGAPGYFELGDIPYPTGEDGFTYFDLMTTFYIDMDSQNSLASYPATFYFDDVELYKETNPENTDQIAGLNGFYAPDTNEIWVGWSHPKYDDKTKYEVRYSFEDIFKTGWAGATPAQGGALAPVSGAYNGMEFSTKAIRVAGHDRVMIAIKPQNSALFRQITIPLAGR